ncbi:MAG: hypothetical protein KME28_21395 [Pelatocladus maniniholoensis HA4357-MV3]|uniref:Uncharacterized protein n=1 Tax=Pelatocladus maniniholoensis HA4357-MV3 TaxID=1117104 RepID=A0A9E3HCG1_9NOST|nr:hypothetical protein [Pelatocladus maniniholoensis HA4357-MV3]
MASSIETTHRQEPQAHFTWLTVAIALPSPLFHEIIDNWQRWRSLSLLNQDNISVKPDMYL